MLYNCSILLYKFLTFFASFFNEKAKKRIDGLRQNDAVLSRLKKDKQVAQKWQLVWFHVASLGEFEQARPVLESFKAKNPTFKILVTFFSPSGFEIRKNYEKADYVLYLPFDLKSDINAFISEIQPSIVFWVKYEYWRNCLRILSNLETPVYLISAIFRKKQPFFKWYGASFRKTLTYFKHIFVQDIDSELLLQTIDIQNVTVAGDTRFDRVAATLKTIKEIDSVKKFKAERSLLVIGSAWEEDLECVFNAKNLAVDCIIIAPHELNKTQLENWAKKYNAIRYSEITEVMQLADYKVLILDTIGMLSSIYQYADAAFIGGAFGKGLHNILEAATFGMPVFFGDKSYKKFKEANDLIALGGAFVVNNSTFETIFNKKLKNKGTISLKVKNYVAENIGASRIILNYISLNTLN